ncbi:MAG: GTP-binding protein, partial [Bdellovibrionales bacterium]|nr:GTP-binding protein [Bdellovibrionales bacterium]
ADPAPLIQSFYMDSECQKKLVIDGVITVVDSKHLPLHLKEKGSEGDIRGAHGEISEAVKQISYADRILLNKIDLVGVNEIVSLKKSVSQLNAAAVVYECVKANVNIQDLLNIKAFDPSKFTSLNYGDLNNQSTILIERDSDGKILKKKGLLDLRKKLTPSTKGSRNIATYSMIAEEAIDLAKFNLWIADLMQTRGADIFRMKGILNISGYEERFIFHGVHMVFDGTRGEKWGVEKRRSKMVVIGVGLLKEELEVGFTTTIA